MSTKSRQEVRQKFPSMLRYLLCLLGIILSLPILVFIVLAFKLPVTISGIGYLLGSSLAISGLTLALGVRRHYIALTITGMTVIALVVSARLILARQDTAPERR